MPTDTCPDTQDDGILVVPTISDTPISPIKLKLKKATLFHDRAFSLLSIVTMSGCCQVTVPFGKHEDCPVGVLFIAFHGLDNFDVKEYVTGFGNPAWKKTHEEAGKIAVVVTALITGENSHYGTPANPTMPSYIPGRSSSGSAVAVAAELVDFL
ncbi:outer envelope protein 64, mitochondrial [Tanacetum coccineum]